MIFHRMINFPWDLMMIDKIYFTKNHVSVATQMTWTDQQTQQMCLLANRSTPMPCNIISHDDELKKVDITILNFNIDDDGDLYGSIKPIDECLSEDGLSRLVFLMSFTRKETENEESEVVMTGVNGIDIL